MNKISKVLLASGAAAAGTAVLGALVTDELLLNRHLILPDKIANKVTDCDMSNLIDLRNKNLAWVENYGYEKHYIKSETGVKLAGCLMKSKKPSDVYVLGVHGYRSTGKIEFSGFCQYYLRQNVNMFFIDHIASGESGGTYCSFGFHEASDTLKWIDYMKRHFGEDIKIILHGVSMGAATVDMLCGSGQLPSNVKMAVADCGYSSGSELFKAKLGPLGKMIGVVDAVTKLRFGFGFGDVNPLQSVKNAKIPMLFVHGSADTFVPCKMTEDVYNNCGSKNKELMIIEGANHAQSSVDGQAEYEAKLTEWMKKYL